MAAMRGTVPQVWWGRFMVTDKEEFQRRTLGLFREMQQEVDRVLSTMRQYSQYKMLTLTGGSVLYYNGVQDNSLVRLNHPFLASHKGHSIWCHAGTVHRQPVREYLFADEKTAPFFRFPVWSFGERPQPTLK